MSTQHITNHQDTVAALLLSPSAPQQQQQLPWRPVGGAARFTQGCRLTRSVANYWFRQLLCEARWLVSLQRLFAGAVLQLCCWL
jgi:hypothetical protein